MDRRNSKGAWKFWEGKKKLEQAMLEQERLEERLRHEALQRDANRRNEQQLREQFEQMQMTLAMERMERQQQERAREEQQRLLRAEEEQRRVDKERLEKAQIEHDRRRKLERLEKARRASPESLRSLRELIRTRYELDVEIWNLRKVRKPDRWVVMEKMERADSVLREILGMVHGWEANRGAWTDEEWEKAEEIRRRLLQGTGKRLWVENPPWEED